MRNCFRIYWLVLLLTFSCGLIGQTSAQTFTTLYSFSSTGGIRPFAGLVSSGNTLYGTTIGGGTSNNGTLFKINTDGSGFTTIYNFTGRSNLQETNSDGANPWASLILSNNTLYGTTDEGGMGGSGTLFAVGADGTTFNNIHSFTPFFYPVFVTNSDGANSHAPLMLSGNTLYGTTTWGGSSGDGVVFSVQTDGSSFSVLHNFSKNDGAIPATGVLLSGNVLYGTTGNGVNGTAFDGSGAVFKINTDGAGFTNVYAFTALDTSPPYTNNDGAGPSVNLILVSNTLYGAAGGGGTSGDGTVFRLNIDGTGFTNLHNFAGYPNEGNGPNGLALRASTFYGTTYEGGISNVGTVFAINIDGSGYKTLHSFSGGSDGSYPTGLILSGKTLYGTTVTGGDSGNGTIFSVSFPPQLTIVPSGSNIILSWPTDYIGFDYSGYTLQATTNLVSPVWTTNLPAPIAVNGQNTVTNPTSGSQQFFRLSQ
jgi:uncharacterized repeat protein (TIGR03803 family)